MGIQGRATARANYKQLHDFLNANFRDATFRHVFLSTSGYEGLKAVLHQKCKGVGPSGEATAILENTTKLQHLIDEVMNTFRDEDMTEHWIKMKSAHKEDLKEGLKSGAIISNNEAKRQMKAENRKRRRKQDPAADGFDEELNEADPAADGFDSGDGSDAPAPKKKRNRPKKQTRRIS